MRKMKKWAAAGAMAVVLSGCTSAEVAMVNDPKTAALPPVYLTKLPERSYEEVAYISVSGSVFTTKRQLVEKLKKTAQKKGVDALVQVKYDYQGYWPVAEAVGIKFTAERQ